MTETKHNAAAVLVAAIVLMIPVSAWQAHVMGVSWGWFVTTQFGVPVPELWIMAGLLMMVRLPFVGLKSEGQEGDTFDRIATMVIYGFVGPLLYLASAWIVASLAGVA